MSFIGRISIVILTAALAGLPLISCGASPEPAVVAQTDEPDYTPAVSVTGVLVPARRAVLSLGASGVVLEVAVEEGQEVAAGQLLLRLSDAQQRAALAEAEAGLAAARAQLDELRAGARPEEVGAARAAVEAARARLARLNEGPRPEEVTAARARLLEAQAALQQVLQGVDELELVAARAEAVNAEAALHQAQAAYDQVKDRADVGALPQSAQLQQATNTYQAALARLQSLEKGPTAAQEAMARARVQQAQAELDRVQAPVRESDRLEADAELRRAEEHLALVESGARGESIRAAEAAVAMAAASVDLAGARLDETQLRAPFAGTVAALSVRAGERVLPNTPLLQLGDLSEMVVETTDLNEIEVMRVQVGDAATVTFDALPALEVSGAVLSIAPKAKPGTGVYYTVTVGLDQVPVGLRWDMTAFVDIQVER